MISYSRASYLIKFNHNIVMFFSRILTVVNMIKVVNPFYDFIRNGTKLSFI